ncbi:MAG: hypothetical protein M3N42_03375, partial [Cyanobacteriota bacterium]|nr:hypothetical protein [Cyanobacteriota bacterium]
MRVEWCKSRSLDRSAQRNMTPPQPPRKPQTILGAITQAVQTIAKVNFNQLALKPNAKVPELWVQDAG